LLQVFAESSRMGACDEEGNEDNWLLLHSHPVGLEGNSVPSERCRPTEAVDAHARRACNRPVQSLMIAEGVPYAFGELIVVAKGVGCGRCAARLDGEPVALG
jgi:hypothetical protein